MCFLAQSMRVAVQLWLILASASAAKLTLEASGDLTDWDRRGNYPGCDNTRKDDSFHTYICRPEYDSGYSKPLSRAECCSTEGCAWMLSKDGPEDCPANSEWCSAFTCPTGYVLKPITSTKIGLSAEVCCDKNFEGTYKDDDGGSVQVSQKVASRAAESKSNAGWSHAEVSNPNQPWSPAQARVEGNKIEIFGTVGMWIADDASIAWKNGAKWKQVSMLQPAQSSKWNPKALCDGFSAEDRAVQLHKNQGLDMEAARAKVMEEFPNHFQC